MIGRVDTNGERQRFTSELLPSDMRRAPKAEMAEERWRKVNGSELHSKKKTVGEAKENAA